MAAYVVVDVVVKDPVLYDDYRKRVSATLEPYGGKFLVRGGKVETLEGTWKPQRFVLVEFPMPPQPARGGTARRTLSPKRSGRALRTRKWFSSKPSEAEARRKRRAEAEAEAAFTQRELLQSF